MAIETIAPGVTPIIPNMLSGYQSGYDMVQKQMTDYRDAKDKANINALMQQNVDENGNVNQAGLLSGLAQNNLGTSVLDTQKALTDYSGQLLDNKNKELAQKTTQLENSQKTLEVIGQVMGGVVNSPNPLLEYNRALTTLHDMGISIAKYPEANSNEEAKQHAQTAVDSSMSAMEKVSAARLQKDLENLELQKNKFLYNSNPEEQGKKEYSKETGKQSAKEDVKNTALDAKKSAFKELINKQADRVIDLINASVESIGGKYITKLSQLTGKAYTPAIATAQLDQIIANWLSNVPFPPGSQSDAEMKARIGTLAPINDPNQPAEQRIAVFKQFQNDLNEDKIVTKLGPSGTSSNSGMVMFDGSTTANSTGSVPPTTKSKHGW